MPAVFIIAFTSFVKVSKLKVPLIRLPPNKQRAWNCNSPSPDMEGSVIGMSPKHSRLYPSSGIAEIAITHEPVKEVPHGAHVKSPPRHCFAVAVFVPSVFKHTQPLFS